MSPDVHDVVVQPNHKKPQTPHLIYRQERLNLYNKND